MDTLTWTNLLQGKLTAILREGGEVERERERERERGGGGRERGRELLDTHTYAHKTQISDFLTVYSACV